ncbi:J domain-containing protein [Desulforhopalus singaporensis]|uniref:J domain-containing protein n=1 Tax=Desulforhopalus singaporensis TaxID=91360 RepID=A0A1H0JWD8_9BACT|nr:J domain-containing protein [Desulforhopalus singaporensis]SDO47986.1 hypothetical protein SAMN05660330_00351 [Desulforhopalus singaporensis]
MYLAEIYKNGTFIYQIRQSYSRDGRGFDHRLVFDLGDDPRRYLHHYDDYVVLFATVLVDAVSAAGAEDPEAMLEQLLWRFLPQQVRTRFDLFSARKAAPATRLSPTELEQIGAQVHLFDRRRLYYLRYGAVDQSRLYRLHEKCCRPLLGQSRDEREFYFVQEEKVLDPGSYFQYVYAIFNLQKHFTQSFASWMPEALAFEEISEYLITAVCCLQGDETFWQKKTETDSLHPHLARYLIMFFDFAPGPRSFISDFARAFMNSHRQFRWPEHKTGATAEQIRRLLGVDSFAVKKMTREELNRLYRQKAMQLHPDKGGDHELFIELTEVYRMLVKSK